MLSDERSDELIAKVGCGACDSTSMRHLGLCYRCVRQLMRLVEVEVLESVLKDARRLNDSLATQD